MSWVYFTSAFIEHGFKNDSTRAGCFVLRAKENLLFFFALEQFQVGCKNFLDNKINLVGKLVIGCHVMQLTC